MVLIWFEPLSVGEVRTEEDMCTSGCNWNVNREFLM